MVEHDVCVSDASVLYHPHGDNPEAGRREAASGSRIKTSAWNYKKARYATCNLTAPSFQDLRCTLAKYWKNFISRYTLSQFATKRPFSRQEIPPSLFPCFFLYFGRRFECPKRLRFSNFGETELILFSCALGEFAIQLSDALAFVLLKKGCCWFVGRSLAGPICLEVNHGETELLRGC